MGNTLLGAFAGFIVIIALSCLFPGIGHVLGGLIGGFVAGVTAQGIIRGAFAGFMAGVAGGIIFTILAFFGTVFAAADFGFFEILFAGIKGLAFSIIVLILSLLGAIIAAIAGFIGGALTR